MSPHNWLTYITTLSMTNWYFAALEWWSSWFSFFSFVSNWKFFLFCSVTVWLISRNLPMTDWRISWYSPEIYWWFTFFFPETDWRIFVIFTCDQLVNFSVLATFWQYLWFFFPVQLKNFGIFLCDQLTYFTLFAHDLLTNSVIFYHSLYAQHCDTHCKLSKRCVDYFSSVKIWKIKTWIKWIVSSMNRGEKFCEKKSLKTGNFVKR